MFVSLAKSDELWNFMAWLKSLTQIKKKSRSRVEPCGAPNFAATRGDSIIMSR